MAGRRGSLSAMPAKRLQVADNKLIGDFHHDRYETRLFAAMVTTASCESSSCGA
jgi:hypothetical protein